MILDGLMVGHIPNTFLTRSNLTIEITFHTASTQWHHNVIVCMGSDVVLCILSLPLNGVWSVLQCVGCLHTGWAHVCCHSWLPTCVHMSSHVVSHIIVLCQDMDCFQLRTLICKKKQKQYCSDLVVSFFNLQPLWLGANNLLFETLFCCKMSYCWLLCTVCCRSCVLCVHIS